MKQKKLPSFKYELREIINGVELIDKEHRTFTRERKSDGHTHKQNLKFYKYKCLMCGYNEGWLEENNINKGYGCACCSANVVVKGINDIHTTANWMVEFIKNKDDAYKYAKTSNKKITFQCPLCLHSQERLISNVYRNGFRCPTCSDGLSFGEKAMASVLKQLNLKFQTQKTFEWSNGKRYDFYIPSLNIVVEIHGGQHYIEAKGWRGLEEEQLNDKIKKEEAHINNLSYIEIDCRESEIEWFHNSVANSMFSKLVDIDSVDWTLVEKSTLTSLIKECCDLWESGINSCTEIAAKVGLSRGTVRGYLLRGAKFNMTSYSKEVAEKVRKDKASEATKRKSKKVRCVTTGKIYANLDEVAQEYGCYKSSISRVCRKERSSFKGHVFEYIE